MKKAATEGGGGQHEQSGRSLSQEHLAKIRSSALNDAVITALKWRSLKDGRLEIDYFKPDGSVERCEDESPFRRWRSSDTKIAQAKARGKKLPKYLSPKANGCRLYHSHYAIAADHYEDRLRNTQIPLRITEGELKTEAASLHDPERLTIGLGGVTSWRDHRNGGEESVPLPELEGIPLEGREVRLCFDSDLNKPQVLAALRALAEWLLERGAHVLIEILPNGLDGARLGLDDLIDRHGSAVFLEIAKIARHPFKTVRKEGRELLVWAFNPEPVDTRERNVYLHGLHGHHWRRSDDAKDHWQHWCGTHWQAVPGDDHLAAIVEQFAALQGWKNRELTTIRSLMAAFRRSISPPANGVGAEGLVPFLSGCLRLVDQALIPHDPEHGNTWSLPFDYAPTAHCGKIQAFLLDRLGDYESVLVIRAFCRALLRSERLKCFLEIIGPSNTGKSVIANLLQAMVGVDNTAAMALHRLEDRQQRFETLKLRNRRLALFSECHDYSGCLNNLKAITGGDPIPAEVKNGRHLDITYLGGVVLVGNAPVRASDPSGAVVNRRRSLLVYKVVQAADERQLLDPDGQGGWKGELAGELAGLVNWCLAMDPAEARAALARDVRSLARAEAELETLLLSDLLAAWAEHALAWDDRDGAWVRVGVANDAPNQSLYANYLNWLEQQGRNTHPLALRSFKAKLVDLLRDTLGLPLPAGFTNAGQYRERGVGSVIPSLRLRLSFEEEAGLIRYAILRRAEVPEAERVKTDAERIRNGKTPAGNGWNGWNGSETLSHKEKNEADSSSSIGEVSAGSVPAVPPIPRKGSQRSASVPEASRSVPGSVQPQLLSLEPRLVGSGADVFSDDDDPAWGPRPEVA